MGIYKEIYYFSQLPYIIVATNRLRREGRGYIVGMLISFPFKPSTHNLFLGHFPN